MVALPNAVSRYLPKLPFPFSAPTVPGGVDVPAGKPRSGSDYDTAWARRYRAGVACRRGRQRSGSDYDTAWARRYPARVARAALLEAVARPAVQALARPHHHCMDQLDQPR